MQLEFMSDAPVGDAELYLYLDEAGLNHLLQAVNAARRSGHEHLMSEQWGGNGLTATDGSTRTFNKVTVTFQS
jgi:hypothetical protein